jgi:hypothetical protein
MIIQCCDLMMCGVDFDDDYDYDDGDVGDYDNNDICNTYTI